MSLALDLEVQFKDATLYQPHVSFATVGPPTAVVIWSTSITGILKLVLDKALELGKEYRPQIEIAAQLAVDAVVEFDLPWIPSSLENTLDEVTRQAGYTAIRAVLDAVLG